MGDSQSRYSIVANLTDKKLELLATKGRLKEDITAKENEVAAKKKDLKDYEADLETQNKLQKREYQRAVDFAQTALDDSKGSLKSKLEVLDTQLKAVEDALKRIEKVSEASAQEAAK